MVMKRLLFLLLLLPGVVFGGIKDQLFAVHATDELPVDGVLHAGYGRDVTGDLAKLRVTVHFSLGELVRPIGKWMSWEKKTYAVVTPLKAILPQLVNLNCYDSFILGDLTLTDEMFLVAPRGTAMGSCVVWEYDPEIVTLRQAIDACIAAQGGWKVTMSSKNKNETYMPAYVDGKDINTHQFFGPLLEERPYLSLGLRWEPLHGEAWHFAPLEMRLFGVIKQPEHVQEDTWEEIEEHRAAIENAYRNADFADISKESIKNLLDLIQSLKHPCH